MLLRWLGILLCITTPGCTMNPLMGTYYLTDELKSSTTLPGDILEIVWHDSLESTQNWASDNLELLVKKFGLGNRILGSTELKWVCVSAREQTEGRGTWDSSLNRSRVWVSPRGSVYATFVIPWPVELRNRLLNFAQVGTFAAAKTLERYAIRPQLKWVNDVLVDGKKIAGVLTTVPDSKVMFGSEHRLHFPVMVGIGLNVLVAGDSSVSATSILTELSPNFCSAAETPALPVSGDDAVVDQVLGALAAELYNAFTRLKEDGFGNYFHNYIDDRLVWKGEIVTVDTGMEQFSGRLLGLNRDGALRLQLQNASSPISSEVVFTVGHLSLGG